MALTAQETLNKLCNVALYVATESSIGYACARLFTKVDPFRASGLFAASWIVSAITRPLFHAIFGRLESSPQSRFVGFLLNHAVSVIVTTSIACLAGCPITLASGVALACYSVAAHVLLASAFTISANAPLAKDSEVPFLHAVWY